MVSTLSTNKVKNFSDKEMNNPPNLVVDKLENIQNRPQEFSAQENLSSFQAVNTYPMFFEEILIAMSEPDKYNVDSKQDFIRYQETLFSVISLLGQAIKKHGISPDLFTSNKASTLSHIYLDIFKYLDTQASENFNFLTKQISANHLVLVAFSQKGHTEKTKNFIENQRKLSSNLIQKIDILRLKNISLTQLLNLFSLEKEEIYPVLAQLLTKNKQPTQEEKAQLTDLTLSMPENILSVAQKLNLIKNFDSSYLQNESLFSFILEQIQKYISVSTTGTQIETYKKEQGNLNNFIKNYFQFDYQFSVGLKNYLEANIQIINNEASYNIKKIMPLSLWLGKLHANQFLTQEELKTSKLLLNTHTGDKKPNSSTVALWDSFIPLFKDIELTTQESIIVLKQYFKVSETGMANLEKISFKKTFQAQYKDSDTSSLLEKLCDAQAHYFMIYFFYHNFQDLSAKDKLKIASQLESSTTNFNSFFSINANDGNIVFSQQQTETRKNTFYQDKDWLVSLVNKISVSLLAPVFQETTTNKSALRHYVVNSLANKYSIQNDFWQGVLYQGLNEIQRIIDTGNELSWFDSSDLKAWQSPNLFESILRNCVKTDEDTLFLMRRPDAKKRLQSNLENLSVIFGRYFDNLIFNEPIHNCWSVGDFFKKYSIENNRFLSSGAIAQQYFDKNPNSSLKPKNKKFLGLFNKNENLDYDKLRMLTNGEISKCYFKNKTFNVEYHISPTQEADKSNQSQSPKEAQGLSYTLVHILEQTQKIIQDASQYPVDLEIKLETQKSSLIFMELLEFCQVADEFLPLNQKIEVKQLFSHFNESVEKYHNVIKKISLLSSAQSDSGFLKSLMGKNSTNLEEDTQKANNQILKHLSLLNENAQSLKISMEKAITHTDLKELMVQGQFLENKFNSNPIDLMSEADSATATNVVALEAPKPKTMVAKKG